MQYQSLGHLPRAPLVYSLAMIEYPPVPSIAEHASAIMELLREEYPDIHDFKVSSLRVDIDAATGESKAHQTSSSQWKMNNPEGNFGLVFGAERLIVHTTVYPHFGGFADKIRKIASVVFDVAKIKYTKSIGIRQIDNLYPIDDLSLSDLVKIGYLCPEQDGEELKPLNSRVEFVYKSLLGRLFIRAYYLEGHPKVPQDLFPIADQLDSDELMAQSNEAFILADTDHIYTPQKIEAFDLEHVISTLDKLHEQCSLGFRKMVTPEAIDAWKKEQ